MSIELSAANLEYMRVAVLQRAKEIEMNARSVRILREKEGFSDTSVLDRAAEFARQRQMRVEAKRAQRLEEENAQIAEAKEAQRLRCLENAKMLRAMVRDVKGAISRRSKRGGERGRLVETLHG